MSGTDLCPCCVCKDSVCGRPDGREVALCVKSGHIRVSLVTIVQGDSDSD